MEKEEEPPASNGQVAFCLLPNGVKCDILYLGKTKRDYRVAALVIPTPTPERPGDRLGDMIAQSRLLGKWGRLCVFPGPLCWGMERGDDGKAPYAANPRSGSCHSEGGDANRSEAGAEWGTHMDITTLENWLWEVAPIGGVSGTHT